MAFARGYMGIRESHTNFTKMDRVPKGFSPLCGGTSEGQGRRRELREGSERLVGPPTHPTSLPSPTVPSAAPAWPVPPPLPTAVGERWTHQSQ